MVLIVICCSQRVCVTAAAAAYRNYHCYFCNVRMVLYSEVLDFFYKLV